MLTMRGKQVYGPEIQSASTVVAIEWTGEARKNLPGKRV